MTRINSFQGKHRFLSNFWLCPVIFDGIQYPSSEHAFVAAKTLDLSQKREITKMITPGRAKRYGRRIELRPDWNQVKVAVMYDIVRAKFAQNEALADKLLATGDALLIEGNKWGDQFWGVCNGSGHNWLGRILVLTRSLITLERS